MEIILLQKIQNLGQLGEVVNVSPGYARNYLIPQAKAKRATPEAIKDVEARKSELLALEADILAKAQGMAEQLKDLSVEIAANASVEGRLFGSVAGAEIAEAVAAKGTEIEKSQVLLPEGPLKQTGEYVVDVLLHPEVRASINVKVIPEDVAA